MWSSRFNHSSSRSKRPKSPFGGEIQSQEEVRKLNKAITAHEKKEFEDFEKEFDAQADRLWKNPRK